MSNPFLASTSKAGHGEITLALLPPRTPRLKTCSYQYPLKLVAPNALYVDDGTLVHTIYLLSYGGGLVAGDAINLTINLDLTTRLVLLTQGSTKIFISPKPEMITRQQLDVNLETGSALCYLPDPVQPFAQSCFEQTQVYHLPALNTASLCVCDWVCRGRASRGENWNFYRYTSKNEVWLSPTDDSGRKRLLLRDNVLLEDSTADGSFAGRMDQMGVFGTLIMYGPMFEGLGKFFMGEFEAMPRIGARNWDGEKEEEPLPTRKRREAQEKKDELLWSAAPIRGFVLVKFGAREVEGVKRWLYAMLRAERSVQDNFGERSLLCLRP
jgi:urease accessory protein